MKKLFAGILIISVLCTFSLAGAESLTSKTDQELLDLYLQIQSVLLSRNANYSLKLNAGIYKIGTDIPAGAYRIECSGAFTSCTISVYTSEKSKYANNTYILSELTQSSVLGKVDLTDGNILEISGSTVSLTSYSTAQIEIETTNSLKKDTSSPGGASEEGLTISPGKYLVGIEIPAGTYKVICEGNYSITSFDVYDSSTATRPSYSTILTAFLGNTEIGKIELSSGNIVEIKDGSVVFYKYQDIRK